MSTFERTRFFITKLTVFCGWLIIELFGCTNLARDRLNKLATEVSEQNRRFSCATLRAPNSMMTWSLIKNRICGTIYGTRTFELTWWILHPGPSTIPPCGTPAGQFLVSQNRGETSRGQCSKFKRSTYCFYCTDRFYMTISKIVW